MFIKKTIKSNLDQHCIAIFNPPGVISVLCTWTMQYQNEKPIVALKFQAIYAKRYVMSFAIKFMIIKKSWSQSECQK